MRQLSITMGNASRTMSFLLGLIVIALAVTAMTTQLTVGDIAAWLQQMLGVSFLVLLAGLISISLYAWVVILRRCGPMQVWMDTGMHAANGITTLALTYTLLGISLGIGSLAEQSLTPETVQEVIRELTANFSLAFLTTVTGLPTATLLRAVLSITYSHRRSQDNPLLLTDGRK